MIGAKDVVATITDRADDYPTNTDLVSIRASIKITPK